MLPNSKSSERIKLAFHKYEVIPNIMLNKIPVFEDGNGKRWGLIRIQPSQDFSENIILQSLTNTLKAQDFTFPIEGTILKRTPEELHVQKGADTYVFCPIGIETFINDGQGSSNMTDNIFNQLNAMRKDINNLESKINKIKERSDSFIHSKQKKLILPFGLLVHDLISIATAPLGYLSLYCEEFKQPEQLEQIITADKFRQQFIHNFTNNKILLAEQNLKDYLNNLKGLGAVYKEAEELKLLDANILFNFKIFTEMIKLINGEFNNNYSPNKKYYSLKELIKQSNDARGKLKSENLILNFEDNIKIYADVIPVIVSVFGNILANNRKYAGGWCEVGVEETADTHIISFKDKGPGINESDLTKIFDMGVSLHNSSGYGLALAKRIIEKYHDGKIWAENNKEKGVTFYVKFPKQKN